jgi:diguanylate cyclase (GGDEF)-like protein
VSKTSSLAARVLSSPHLSDWHLFRASAGDILELVPFLAELQAMANSSMTLAVHATGRFVCFLETGRHTSSVLAYRNPPLTVAYTEAPSAVSEFEEWAEKIRTTSFATDAVSHVVGLLRSAERAIAAESLIRIAAVFQFEERPELEFEPWHRSLVTALRSVTSADMWQVRPRVSADFWESRGERWTWKYADDLPADPPDIEPRVVNDLCRAGLIECVSGASSELASAVFMPLKMRNSILGLLALYYAHPVTVFPGEMRLLEALQKEVANLMDRTRHRLRMQRMATIDGLTNLFNHRFFRIQLRIEFQRALRYQKKMAMVMIDIDDFKGYNDRYGHLAGDRVLAEVARVIRSTVRDIDLVARYGGEEFALILPEVDSTGGLVVAEKVRAAVGAQEFRTESGEGIGSITVSCGVTDNVNTTSPNDLIRRADRALYWVKTHGRNLVRLADPMDDA